jgi:hypothetical protein
VLAIDTVGGTGETFEAYQCLEVTASKSYELGLNSMIDSAVGDAPTLSATVCFFRNLGCTDLLKTSEAVVAEGNSGGNWGSRLVFSAGAPVEALSAQVGFVVQGGSAAVFTLHLDEAAFFEDLLFVDGFESGDSSRWSGTNP